MSAPRLTVAILAGGAASRLGGRDKGLELLGGKPMIARVLAYVRTNLGADDDEHDIDVLIVANRNLDEYAKYARVVTDADAEFRGPLAGVASALDAGRAARVLTLPVDCPMPPADLAGRLAAILDETSAQAAVAHDGERRQPLFALYRRDLARAAAEAAAERQGVHQWQDTLVVVEVDFADRRRQFHNLNTPAEFAAYSDALRSRD